MKENILDGYPKVISYESTKKILEQMEKNVFKIKIGFHQGTGFFCKIPFPDINNMLPVLINTNHIIDEEYLYTKDKSISIQLKGERDFKNISLNDRIKYTNEEYDVTIIEIKEYDNIQYYLELNDIFIDDIVNNINTNIEFIDKTIYIIQYPEGELSVSYGIVNNIYKKKKYNFNHKCSTKGGSSGSPILSIKQNKIIGIHKEGYNNNYNTGAFLNYPIKEFINLNYYKIKKNEKINDNINEILLKEFNNKYDLIIKDTNIDKINLSLK